MSAQQRGIRVIDGLIEWFDEVTGRATRRRLEEELRRADVEIARLRAHLADATRPPTQFARMRQREVAIRRLTRLQIARDGRSDAGRRGGVGLSRRSRETAERI